MGNGGILKSTKYCDLLVQGLIFENDMGYALEKIRVKSTGNEEIRFTYYKMVEGNKIRFVPRPLDLSEEDLLKLFKEAKDKKVFSNHFLNELRKLV